METLILAPLSDLLILDADGFEQNIMVEERQRDTCSDVTGNGVAGDAVVFLNCTQ